MLLLGQSLQCVIFKLSIYNIATLKKQFALFIPE